MPVPTSKDNPEGRRARVAMLAGLPAGFAMITAGKFVTNVAFRLVFPFLPRIAAGLGVSIAAMGTALAIRDLAGLTNPALGRAADRRGHGSAMVLAMVGLAFALTLQAVSNGLLLFTVALISLSITKALFDVAAAAWVGGAVPFVSRGRAIGLLETSWAAAFIVGMPIAALTIRATTWRTPFLIAAGLCIVMAFALDNGVAVSAPPAVNAPRPAWTPALRAAIATFALMGVGHSMMLVTFASWLEDSHGVSIAALGLTAMVIGLAEFGGSAGSAGISDRLGLTRSLEGALLGCVVASLLLPIGSGTFGLALASMVLYFMAVEFSIVTVLSLFSELDQKARGAVIGLAFAAFALGHAAGAVAGSQIYQRWGMTENAVAMAAVFALAYVPARTVLSDPVSTEDATP
jgi:DHA1 family inner membrane transport protein